MSSCRCDLDLDIADSSVDALLGLAAVSHTPNSTSLSQPTSQKSRKHIHLVILKGRQGQIHFMILMSRQGKVRLAKWYSTHSQKERAKVIKEITPTILARPLKLCNFLEWKNIKLVYKRYASLYFVCGVDTTDNELITLEVIHEYVEVLDRYFGNVCELDLIFNFHKAYYILDEVLIAGELQEPSKRNISRAIEAQDVLVENMKLGILEEGMSMLQRELQRNRSTRESGSDTTAPVRKRGEAPLQKEPDNSANEKKQIDLLIKLHSEEEVVDKKFQLELVALKSKFQDLYGELYEDRANVVAGDLSVGHDEDDDDVEKVAPLPKFWLKALLGCEVTKDLISRRDAAILEHLSDIQAKTTVNDEGLPNGFILSFFFSENKYLASEVLVKEYLMDPEDDSLEDTIGCDVKWRRG
eukprot:gene28897-32090_t